MKAIVMAGGFGTRIQPLTNAVPKPMLPVLNKPMMEDVIMRLKEIGVKEFIILLYFKPEVIQNYFGDGSEFGIHIQYIIPEDDFGTAGAVKKAEELIGNERFIIVSGDLITDFNFEKILDFHEKNQGKVTITLTSVSDPLQFGVVITDKEGKIQRFLEKPSWGEVFSDTINTGIYVIEPEILSYIPENTNFDFSKDLFPKLMKEEITLWGCDAKGYWRDVGNPNSYREVMEDILNGDVNIDFSGDKIELEKGVVFTKEENVIPKGLKAKGVNIIGENVKIHKDAEIENCTIGNNTVIDKKAVIKNSTIWNDCFIGEKTVVNNSVICNNNVINKKTEIPYGAIIAEHCELESSVRVAKDITIWPNKLIEESSIVSQNVIWGDKYKRSIFEGGKVRGHTNVELSAQISVKLAEAFASTLPVGSKVYVSRDYHNASRMLKRAFMAGLMSSGIEIVNPNFIPSNVLINNLSKNEDIVAGVHFRQSESNSLESEILFFDKNGMLINSGTEKNCERVFFRESFRRVSLDDLGDLSHDLTLTNKYIDRFNTFIDKEALRSNKPKFLIDLLFGTTSQVYPEVINNLGIANVMINSYFDEKKLSKLPVTIEDSKKNSGKIITSLQYHGGFLIYPHGRKLDLICDTGNILDGHLTLLLVLWLLNETAEKKLKVYLPVSAPDVLDKQLTNLKIKRSKMNNIKYEELQKYDFKGGIDGSFAFFEFGINSDAMFASVKIIEMLAKVEKPISQIVKSFPKFYYQHQEIQCSVDQKGLMMRKFTEEAMGKESSFEDGVKIINPDGSTATMVPDQYAENLHLYIQSDTKKDGEALLEKYREKIESWKK